VSKISYPSALFFCVHLSRPIAGCVNYEVAFKVYDMDRDGYISNGELFLVLKMMVGSNLKVWMQRSGSFRRERSPIAPCFTTIGYRITAAR
jgi:hypothetical protein